MSLGCEGDGNCGCYKRTEEGLAGILGDLGWAGTCAAPQLDGSIDDANSWSAACFPKTASVISTLYAVTNTPVPVSVAAAIANPSQSIIDAKAVATGSPESPTLSPIVDNSKYILWGGLALVGLALFGGDRL